MARLGRRPALIMRSPITGTLRPRDVEAAISRVADKPRRLFNLTSRVAGAKVVVDAIQASKRVLLFSQRAFKEGFSSGYAWGRHTGS